MPEKSRLETVAQMWESYSRVLPPDAGLGQIAETRRAFYAGAHAMLRTFERIGEDDVPEGVGVAHLEAAKKELRRFNTDVLRGLR